jgi:hypothetical protein
MWTWGGSSFGRIDEDALWSHDGRHVEAGGATATERLVASLASQEYSRVSPSISQLCHNESTGSSC